MDPAYAPPDLADERTHVPRRELQFDTIRITAWTYAVYFVIYVPIFALSASPALPTAVIVLRCMLALLFALAALSTLQRRRLGYYFCIAVSALMLFAPPIGTVLGWNMLRSLRRHREQFAPNPLATSSRLS